MKNGKFDYLPIADYALLSDCRSAALASRCGSIDWCCMPRMDADSCFARLLDIEHGGHCSISAMTAKCRISRRYVDGTMVLTTSFSDKGGRVDIYDFFNAGYSRTCAAHSELIRMIVGVSGKMSLKVDVAPRFNYGSTLPKLEQVNKQCHTAFGGDNAVQIMSAFDFEKDHEHALSAVVDITAGQRSFLLLRSIDPTSISANANAVNQQYVETALGETKLAWQQWLASIREYRNEPEIMQSALVLKALTYAPTGAVVGAPTTSLPEAIGGGRNWDYRFCWIRDSVYAADILFTLGMHNEANALNDFIERSCAGNAAQLQTLYAIDGKRRLTEFPLSHLTGYKNSAPVRIGNDASNQHQWDMFGELLQLASLVYGGQHHPREFNTTIEGDYEEFLIDVLDHVCEHWHEPDRGIWEFRDHDRHLVHSKASCWSALNHGISLAGRLSRKVSIKRWSKERDAIRAAIEQHGFDRKRGVYRQAFDSDNLDAAVLRLPRLGFIDYCNPCMMSSVEIIKSELDANGLLRRYDNDDGLDGDEGKFLPCTFWLVECLARQNRLVEAKKYYRKAMRCRNDLGLFSEEYDTENECMLGNFPQALTHSSQIVARMALLNAENSGRNSF